MKCPVCRDVSLEFQPLEENLTSRQCPRCAGRWVDGEHFWLWLERHKNLPETKTPVPDANLVVHDTLGVKLCPKCGRFLTRCKVGHGVDFHLDRCAGCSGLWFDAGEWEVLKAKGLHDDVHFVFSAAWQAQVAHEDQQHRHEDIVKEKLGPADFCEIQRIKKWLDEHPKRRELYAFLLDR